MATQSIATNRHGTPRWLAACAISGIAWNVFGAWQFASTVTASEAGLVASGLPPHQAAVMMSHPAWMTAAFGLGVFGGLAGSVLLLLRRPAAMPVLLMSLIAYMALWIGEAMHGVFDALGWQQVFILTLVVAIAAALWALSRHPAARA